MSVWRRISAFIRSTHVVVGSGSGPPLSSRLQPFIRSTVQMTRRQLDYIACQRIRRTLSSIRLHGQLWRSDRLARIVSRVVRALFARMRRRHLLGLTAATSVASAPSEPTEDQESEEDHSSSSSSPSAKKKGIVDWDSSRIPDSLMESHREDLDYVKMLVKKTLTCGECGRRHVIEGKVEGVEYCACQTARASVYGEQSRGIEWTPFLERKDILIWRQEHPPGSGLYAYKMYGHFADVTPSEFVEVQLDMSEYRLRWDESTSQCYVIEEEGSLFEGGLGSNLSHIYYWEVNWPRFFANRDYVACRRARVFDKVAVLYSRSTTHPTAPKKAKSFRVEDYWSVLTVRPTRGWNEPGLEFSLTAFENPGLRLPSSITTWVAIRGMPEFMNNLRRACLELRKWKKAEEGESEEAPQQSSKKANRESEPSYMSTAAAGEASNGATTASAKSCKERQSDDTDLLNSNARLNHS